MKIAIITHPLEKNIGGIMQAFALQKKLYLYNHVVETIDYRPIQHNKLFRHFKFFIKKVLNSLKLTKESPLYEDGMYLKNKKFIKENIVLSRRHYFKPGLTRYINKEKIETLIVGSDQTWRPKYIIDLCVYYLGFSTTVNKVAYASSFGVSDWEYSESQTILVKKLIKDFKAVSVRENDGVLLCKDYLNVDSCCVADPTLLLEQSLYEDLCHDIPIFNKQKYLFYYVLDNNKDKQNYAVELAKKLNLDILIVENKNEGLFLTNTDIEIGPKEWLSLFKYSEFVITDSYHGMVFSLKFKRQFMIFGNKKRGMSRFSSLLDIVDLNDRMVNVSSEVLYQDISVIDYDRVDEKLNNFITFSENFLIGALNKVEN